MNELMVIFLLQEAARLLENTSMHTSAHVEEFTVPFDLMGLAIGSHGANIQSARNIEGVEDIQLVESNDGHTPVLFKVYIDFYYGTQEVLRAKENGSF